MKVSDVMAGSLSESVKLKSRLPAPRHRPDAQEIAMNRLAAALTFSLVACLAAGPARADVTIKSTVKATGPAAMEGQSVSSIKGTKMRVETTMSGAMAAMMPNAQPGQPMKTVTIVDAAARQMTVLDAATKTATVYDLSKMADQMQQAGGPGDVKVSIAPTGQTRQILGRACAEFTLTVSMTVTPPTGGAPMTITLGGPTWIAKDAPGTADFAAFYKAAGESGLFFQPGGGRGAGANPQTRGMAAMYKALADTGGIPYEQIIRVDFGAEGPMADMMKRVGQPGTTMTVTDVTTNPIPDELFAIPAGYTTKKQ
jgi:hypothetical protein